MPPPHPIGSIGPDPRSINFLCEVFSATTYYFIVTRHKRAKTFSKSCLDFLPLQFHKMILRDLTKLYYDWQCYEKMPKFDPKVPNFTNDFGNITKTTLAHWLSFINICFFCCINLTKYNSKTKHQDNCCNLENRMRSHIFSNFGNSKN